MVLGQESPLQCSKGLAPIIVWMLSESRFGSAHSYLPKCVIIIVLKLTRRLLLIFELLFGHRHSITRAGGADALARRGAGKRGRRGRAGGDGVPLVCRMGSA